MRLFAVRLPLALAAVAVALPACVGDPPEPAESGANAAPPQPPRVSYRYDGSEDQLQHVKRLAGYYCEDRYQKSAGLVRTTLGNDGFSEAVYKCI